VYATGADGVTEFRATRTDEPWSRAVIDERAAEGQACAAYSGPREYVFAQRVGTGLIALRQHAESSWTPVASAESLFQSDQIAAVPCGRTAPADTHALVTAATRRNGGVRGAIPPDAGEPRVTSAELTAEAGASPYVLGRLAIAGNDGAFDLIGISSPGQILHW